jgi:ABC-2 type transport system permease protein
MMTINQQRIALYTLIRREFVRMFRIAGQVFLPPVITTLLYFLIFGVVIGERVGSIRGINYAEFISPGLIMMAVITNSYANVSTSLFSARFQKSIEEILVSPMHNSLFILGFVLSGILRGVIVAILVYVIACFFIKVNIATIPASLLIVILVAALFSLAGFANGILAVTFDDVALVPTFILAPMTYLGGVFYGINMLSPFWQKVSHFNPVYYMVSALRQAMLGQNVINMPLALTIICGITIALIVFNILLLKKGVGLRD